MRWFADDDSFSSRQLTTFSDFRWKSGPDFMTVEQYLDYLGAYCEAFRLSPYIDFCCRVTNVRQNGSGRHVVSYTKNGEAQEWICDAVAICTGLHVHPSLVPLDGVENIPKSIHSADFKSSAQFENAKTVLILGSGETAADVAHLAVTSGSRRVVLCHRDGFHLAPKVIPHSRRSCADASLGTSLTSKWTEKSKAEMDVTIVLINSCKSGADRHFPSKPLRHHLCAPSIAVEQHIVDLL
ncbi:hypothetical protein PMIN03_013119 [Paraphaeosphaeria minitans]